DEDGVIPGANRFADPARGSELCGVAFPFIRAARHRIGIARRQCWRALDHRFRRAASAASDEFEGQHADDDRDQGDDRYDDPSYAGCRPFLRQSDIWPEFLQPIEKVAELFSDPFEYFSNRL